MSFRFAYAIAPVARASLPRTIFSNLPSNGVVRPLAARFLSGGKLERTQSFVNVSPIDRSGRKTAEDAVNNILYNAPVGSRKEEKHILSVLVDNEAGVLSKVSGLLSARGFNIDSLTVTATDVRDLSRMTIVLKGAPAQVEQAKRQLEDLVDVWAVLDFAGVNVVERELLMIKVNCVPPEPEDPTIDELLADDTSEVDVNGSTAHSYEGVMSRHFHRQAIVEIAKMFEGTIVDIGSDHMMIEVVSWPKRIDAFIKLLQPFGIIEAARSGAIAMARSPVGGAYEDLENADELRTVVSLADLPPS